MERISTFYGVLRMKGLVVDVKKNSLILLTPDGRFVKVCKKAYAEVGTEYELDYTVKQHALGRFGEYASIAAAILILAFSAYIIQAISVSFNTVYAYISIDINPSVELGVNRYGNVLSVECMNSDAEDMIEANELKSMKIERAVEIITQRAIDKGYIKPDVDNNILITLSYSGNTFITDRMDKLVRSSKAVIERKQLKSNIEAIHAHDNERIQARQMGLTTGKYLIYKEALEQGLKIDIKDVKGKNLNKAIRDAGGDYGNIVSSAKQNADKQIEQKQTGKFRIKQKQTGKPQIEQKQTGKPQIEQKQTGKPQIEQEQTGKSQIEQKRTEKSQKCNDIENAQTQKQLNIPEKTREFPTLRDRMRAK